MRKKWLRGMWQKPRFAARCSVGARKPKPLCNQWPWNTIEYRSPAWRSRLRCVAKALRQAGFRVEADLRNEKINYKIREHSVHKLPYQIVVGEKEKAVGMVAVRVRGGQDLGQMSLDSLIERWRREVEAKAGPI